MTTRRSASLLARVLSRRGADRPARLLGSAGRARGARGVDAGFEALEPRVLLGGDHPSFILPLTPDSGTEIVLNGQGTGSVSGTIDPSLDDDLFRFVAPADDFVTVWADTVNAAGSTLDSRVQVYDIDGMLLADGSDNSKLSGSPSVFSDGWAAFIAQAGETYFVRVLSDKPNGAGSTGDYIIRVDALTTDLAVNAGTGVGAANGNITIAGNDTVFRVVVPAGDLFESLATINATADAAVFDSRLDVYDAGANRIAFDSLTGNLTNAFTTIRGEPEATFYVRVRGDVFDPANQLSTGAFALVVDFAATEIGMDPVTRLGSNGGGAGGTSTSLFVFESQGSGLTIITTQQNPLAPVDSAIRVFNDSGQFIGFNDGGQDAEVQIQLSGGQRYFVVVEGFDQVPAGLFSIFVESNHTFSASGGYDDHINTPPPPDGADEFDYADDASRRQFELATPLIWGDPRFAIDPATGLPLLDHELVIDAIGQGRIHTATDTDLFQFVPPRDVISVYNGDILPDSDPEVWIPPSGVEGDDPGPSFRPSSKLAIVLGGTFGSFGNYLVRVFDSNLKVVYPRDGGTNDTIAPPFPDPAGSVDRSLFQPPDLELIDENIIGIDVFGGEVYYVEVSTLTGTGRYTLSVTTEALGANDGSGFFDGQIGDNFELVGEGTFDLNLIPELTFGGGGNDATNFIPTTIGAYAFRLLGYTTPNDVNGNGFPFAYSPFWIDPNPDDPLNPDFKWYAVHGYNDGWETISSIDDSDRYFFTAPLTGTVEIRIGTTFIPDENFELQIECLDLACFESQVTISNVVQKNVNSPLDSALRVYNNDLIQIAYNRTNDAIAGEYAVQNIGSFDPQRFYRRDARVVVHVNAGERYFVQVESGQRWASGASLQNPADRTANAAHEVDWRRAAGSYMLFINAMPDLQFDDDHSNLFALPTPLAFDALGKATITGEIDHTLANPTDFDVFEFYAPVAGAATITVTRPVGSTVAAQVTIYEVIEGVAEVVATASAGVDGTASTTVNTSQGDHFLIQITSGPEGAYTLSVSGMAPNDDHASLHDWWNATQLEVLDFLGSATATGSIESPADTDIFKFDTEGFDVATLTIESTGGGLDTFVRVYEISEDPLGNPILLQIAFNDDISATDTNSRVNLPLTAPDRTSLVSGNTYNTYYIVVSGFDPSIDDGTYRLTLSLGITDDHADEGQFDFATNIVVTPSTGLGSATGVLERSGDTDLFKFTAPAGGTASVAVTTAESDLDAILTIMDAGGNVLGVSGGPTPVVQFTVVRNATYFVLVSGDENGTDEGSYTVNVTAPTLDDHANETEFNFATVIVLSGATGDGLATGEIGQLGPPIAGIGDTDLFVFTVVGDGDVEIMIIAPENSINPVVRIFDGATNEIISATDGGAGDEDGLRNQIVEVTISGALRDDRFFILVSADPFGFAKIGAYTTTVNGEPAPDGGNNNPDDDHADEGEFSLASAILLDPLTADGQATGKIEVVDDSDLFTFVSLAAGQTFVHVITPIGAALNASVTIYGPGQNVITSDSSGIPGVTASVDFQITGGGQQYYVLVKPVGPSTGDYRVRVDSAPATFFLYSPEGFVNQSIREFVSIANPNDFAVSFRVVLRYEMNLAETVVGNGVLAAGSRGGVTISDGKGFVQPGVAVNSPYSIVVESNGPLGATLARYDFGTSIGESLTFTTSAFWIFPRVERFPGQVEDFIVYYNPNPTAVTVTLTAFTSTGNVTLVQETQGFRRGGWSIDDQMVLPAQVFGVTLTSEPVNGHNDHIGIVAALSHYDLAGGSGYMMLGDPEGGSTVGVVPRLTHGAGVTAELVLFNPGITGAVVTVTGRYIDVGLPDLLRSVTVGAGSVVRLSGATLGMVSNQPVGISYSSTQPLTVVATEVQSNDANATLASTLVGQTFFFGDGFINSNRAGTLYLETLSFYNPSTVAIPVTVTFYFNDSTLTSTVVTVSAQGFASIKLHQLSTVLDHGLLNFYSIGVSASSPFAVTMTHYDLFLGGGWGTGGAPLGLLVPLNTIGLPGGIGG